MRSHDSDMRRFFMLRERLFSLIRDVDEGYHKSYEGAMDVTMSFPSIFESDGAEESPEVVSIHLHCYLLCDGRHKEFAAPSFSECLDRFEEWLTNVEAAEYEAE